MVLMGTEDGVPLPDEALATAPVVDDADLFNEKDVYVLVEDNTPEPLHADLEAADTNTNSKGSKKRLSHFIPAAFRKYVREHVPRADGDPQPPNNCVKDAAESLRKFLVEEYSMVPPDSMTNMAMMVLAVRTWARGQGRDPAKPALYPDYLIEENPTGGIPPFVANAGEPGFEEWDRFKQEKLVPLAMEKQATASEKTAKKAETGGVPQKADLLATATKVVRASHAAAAQQRTRGAATRRSAAAKGAPPATVTAFATPIVTPNPPTIKFECGGAESLFFDYESVEFALTCAATVPADAITVSGGVGAGKRKREDEAEGTPHGGPAAKLEPAEPPASQEIDDVLSNMSWEEVVTEMGGVMAGAMAAREGPAEAGAAVAPVQREVAAAAAKEVAEEEDDDDDGPVYCGLDGDDDDGGGDGGPGGDERRAAEATTSAALLAKVDALAQRAPQFAELREWADKMRAFILGDQGVGGGDDDDDDE